MIIKKKKKEFVLDKPISKNIVVSFFSPFCLFWLFDFGVYLEKNCEENMERHVPESFPHPLHSVPPHHKQEEAQVLHQDCTEQSQRKTVDVGIRAIFIGNKLLIATIKIHTYRTNKFTAA